MSLTRGRSDTRKAVPQARIVAWCAFFVALTALATSAFHALRGRAVALEAGSWLVPLVWLLVIVNAGLIVALVRARGAARLARDEGQRAVQQGETLRAHLEQQGRTARREAQEHLALVEALFCAAPAGLALYDADLQYVRVNQSLADIHEVAQAAHLGRRLRDLVPSMAAEIERALREVLASGEVRAVEVTGRLRAASSPRTWLVHCAPVRDAEGEVIGVAQVVLDITERKAAERQTQELLLALQAEQEIFDVVHRVGQQLAAQLHVGALAQSLVDAAAQLSNAESAVFVYASNAVGAKPEYALSGRIPASSQLDGEALLQVFSKRDGALRLSELGADEVSRKLQAALGELGHAGPVRSLIAVPVSRARGPRAAALLVFHRRPQAFSTRDESILLGLATQAATALENARLYGEAQSLIRALAQTNRELDQFAYVASHDLKAPLRGIANIASWLEEDLGDSLPAQSREHLALMRTRVSRLENMIGGILRYSRAGRSNADKESVNVAELVQEVVSLLSPKDASRVHVVGELPVLCTERIPLQQVFLNLIDNALKYGKREDLRVEVSARRLEQHVQFSVRDNGPGIAEEDEPQIWELFRGSGGESSGIGLAVVRKTVEARGGQAWVESAPQAGATFHFTWPVA